MLHATVILHSFGFKFEVTENYDQFEHKEGITISHCPFIAATWAAVKFKEVF